VYSMVCVYVYHTMHVGMYTTYTLYAYPYIDPCI
jgi:hypothetical protein